MTDRELIAKHRAACGECERVLAGQATFCTVAKFIESQWWDERAKPHYIEQER